MKKEIFLINSAKIKDIILESLDKKEGQFLLRFGDGEMIIIKNDEERMTHFCIKQINRKITKEELQSAQNWLKESVASSTILGIPNKKHIKKGNLWKGILEYYESVEKEVGDKWIKKDYCTIDAHIELLENNDLFQIFNKIEKVVLVTPRDIRNQITKKFPNIKEIEWYSLPAEQMYEVDKNTEVNIFQRIEEISIALKSKKRNGELLFFGAGPFGKILGTRFYQVGGIALDLGSVFDTLVGKLTRGNGRGATSKIDPRI